MISFSHKVFMEVARHLSFTRASEAVFISQPAVSKHIRQLEQHYKVSLFERQGSVVKLTKAGEVLYQHLQTASLLSRQAESDLQHLNDDNHIKGELKLGASTTVALYIIPPVLSGFRIKNSGIKISLLNKNSETIVSSLLNQEIDLGIVEGKNKMAKLSSKHFLSDEVVPVCSSRSQLGRKTRYSLEELKNIPIALREKGSGTLAVLSQALAKHQIKLSQLNICMRLGGTEALKNFLLADDCLGFLPLRSVAKELASGELIRLHIPELSISRHFYFVQRPGEENNPTHQAFIRFAKMYYNLRL